MPSLFELNSPFHVYSSVVPLQQKDNELGGRWRLQGLEPSLLVDIVVLALKMLYFREVNKDKHCYISAPFVHAIHVSYTVTNGLAWSEIIIDLPTQLIISIIIIIEPSPYTTCF